NLQVLVSSSCDFQSWLQVWILPQPKNSSFQKNLFWIKFQLTVRNLYPQGMVKTTNPKHTPPTSNHPADKQTPPQYKAEKPDATAEPSDACPAAPILGGQSHCAKDHCPITTALHTAEDRTQQSKRLAQSPHFANAPPPALQKQSPSRESAPSPKKEPQHPDQRTCPAPIP
ncbi:hypothetical protein CRENBAI_003631, partial [Crenichthys baileyi]